MPQTALLMLLYTTNMLWFSSAFFQFSFRQKHAMRSGTKHPRSKNSVVKSAPEGDAWHHDLLAYLGGMNLALAGLAILRLAVLLDVPFAALSTFTTGSAKGDKPMDVLSLTVLGLANFSQARVNLYVVRGTGRWIMGDLTEAITLVDGLLTVFDWTSAIYVAWNS